ncbi:indole-3-acetic acid-amido synthetase GH3.6-like [Momordica charantia]|uniref:Indole-3-acetic acid-amido synthetase GH3.6-like n=1 Tax=Momordica charantia TaxID=3673 RepID=A0A6J1CIS9_MOMCH|nr:indole-3-acetic acid-amido synthetase GH3.6-like [Momordica charantia]
MSNLDEKDKQALQDLEDVTRTADEIQRRVLTEILSTNAHVEYLQQHGLNGSTDASTFKNLIPIVSYEHLKPYIDRIVNGDDSPILCAHPITEFYTSTGTSGGEQKLIPTIEQEFARKLSISNYMRPRMKQLFPGLHNGKEMFFNFAKVESITKAGIVARSVSTSFLKSPHLNNVKVESSYTSPTDILCCTDVYQSLYCQLLCGLCQNQKVVRVGSLFASTLIYIFKFLENHWVLLANDIRTGTINAKIMDSYVRKSVMNILKPDPQLADFIESECSKGTWEGIVTRLWPNTKFINAVVTGSMSHYIPQLNYYCKSLPLITVFYASSECFFGINLDPLCKPEEISYTFIPTVAYFEFLPVDRTNDSGEVGQEFVDLVDVKLGQEYEIVVTTYAGLYRYCIGDIVRVTGFKNKAPNFRFVGRKNVILSLDVEKTDEAELHNAVNKVGSLLSSFGAILVDYTSYADSSTFPGHYVLYWEIQFKEEISIIPSSIYEDCCLAIEESLSSVYRRARSHQKVINPLEIKIVEARTFDKLMERMVDQGASISQYKTPRCVKSTQIIEFLDSKVVANYFSKKYPKWDPTRPHPNLFGPASSFDEIS